jgi:hypothetical protein
LPALGCGMQRGSLALGASQGAFLILRAPVPLTSFSTLVFLSSPPPPPSSQYHILPNPKLFKCTGPFFSSACPVRPAAAGVPRPRPRVASGLLAASRPLLPSSLAHNQP